MGVVSSHIKDCVWHVPFPFIPLLPLDPLAHRICSILLFPLSKCEVSISRLHVCYLCLHTRIHLNLPMCIAIHEQYSPYPHYECARLYKHIPLSPTECHM